MTNAKRNHCQGMSLPQSWLTIRALAGIIGKYWAAENFLVNIWSKTFFRELGWKFLFTGQEYFFVKDKEGFTHNDIREWENDHPKLYTDLMDWLNRRAYTLGVARLDADLPLIVFRKLSPTEYATINLGHHLYVYGDWWDVTSKSYREYSDAVGQALSKIDPELAFKVYGIKTDEQKQLVKLRDAARGYCRVGLFNLGEISRMLGEDKTASEAECIKEYKLRLEGERNFVLNCGGDIANLRELKDTIQEWRLYLRRGDGDEGS